jgi:NADH:ubiquinone oxidoreductase subunit 6 (subunit J)
VSARDVLLVADALLAAAAAILAVTTRQVVHAALWLVVALGAVAGAYLLLGAELVALVQVLVYVGAIVVLVLFALMLTRAPIGISDDVNNSRLQRVSAALAALATAGLVGGALMTAYGGVRIRVDTARGGSGPLARSLFSSWALPFELLSLLLLAALVAAFALSRGPVPDLPATPQPGEDG